MLQKKITTVQYLKMSFVNESFDNFLHFSFFVNHQTTTFCIPNDNFHLCFIVFCFTEFIFYTFDTYVLFSSRYYFFLFCIFVSNLFSPFYTVNISPSPETEFWVLKHIALLPPLLFLLTVSTLMLSFYLADLQCIVQIISR